jgi:proton glutamate symport protein
VLTVAHDTAEIGPNTLVGMGSFLAKYFAGAGVMFIIATMVIKLRTRATFMQLFEIMRDPIIISLATQNTTAAIPSSIQSLQRFGYEKNLVQLLIPIGSIIARFGTVLYFGFCAVFALQLYGIQPGASEIVLLALITIFAGLATAGQTGPLTMTALAVVLTPIGIPVSGILPMLLTIDALADPIRTLTNTYTNCAATSLIGKPIGPLLTIEQLERDETAEAKKTTPF